MGRDRAIPGERSTARRITLDREFNGVRSSSSPSFRVISPFQIHPGQKMIRLADRQKLSAPGPKPTLSQVILRFKRPRQREKKTSNVWPPFANVRVADRICEGCCELPLPPGLPKQPRWDWDGRALFADKQLVAASTVPGKVSKKTRPRAIRSVGPGNEHFRRGAVSAFQWALWIQVLRQTKL